MDNTNLKVKTKQILQEWMEFNLPDQHFRNLDIGKVNENQLVSIIGPRRAGKTYTCFQIIRELLAQNNSRKNLVYINFEDERLHPMTGSELTVLWDVFRELNESYQSQKIWFLLDEIQNVPNWSKWVRRVTDQNKNVHVIVTGSSSKMLSNEIATELRGRAITITVYPYSFKEYLHVKGKAGELKPNPTQLIHSNKRFPIINEVNNFFNVGGFPGVTQKENRQEILQAYYRTMFIRDIIERHKLSNVKLLEDYLKVQISRFSSLSSFTKIENDIKSLGHRFTKNTLSLYFEYAKDIFLMFDSLIYSPKVKDQLRYSRKIYAVDHGLLKAIRFSSTEDWGRVLENMVYMEYRRNFEVYYFADKVECDFICLKNGDVTEITQAAYSIKNLDTKKRELKGLVTALKTFNLKRGKIITWDEFDSLDVDGYKIEVLPFWYFALNIGK